ncbi:MAG TPA: autotransporter domain-containing protein [Sphingomicrobium sp.]
MFDKALLGAIAGASALAIASAATPASAQQIDRIVVFGDSYADTGNAFKLGYANPQALQVYPTGRFSGGTNYIDTLSNILQAPVENFAIGGAMGGTNNGTLCFDATYGAPLCGKGLQYEVNQFLGTGAQSSVFPNADTTLTRNDLLAVSIGGNDARIYQQGGGTLATAAAAGTAAGVGTAAQLDRLVAHGNPTIAFLALNGAVAPEVALNPAAQQIRGTFATAYYNQLQPVLAGYAANGSIVHYLDGQLLLQNIAANPSAYGVTNGLVCPVFPNPACALNSNGYLFYGDALHLTSLGFEILGRYTAVQIAAPLTLQGPSDLGMTTARQWGRTLSSRSDLYRGASAAGLRFFVVGDAFSRNGTESDNNDRFEADGGGITAGAEYGMPTATIGLAANYTRPKLHFGKEAARIKGRSLQIGAYGNVDLGGIFAQGYAGYGKDRNRITRTGVLEDMSARPNGSHVTAGAKAGYLLPLAAVRLGPVVAIDYARAKVDGYTEDGDAALRLNVGKQAFKATTGRLGVEARANIAQLNAYADLGVEHEFSGDGRMISFSQTSAPTIVNHWDIQNDKQTYGRLTAGANVRLLPNLSVDVAGSTTFARDGGDELGGQVGLKASF